jgi:hypothetical protein
MPLASAAFTAVVTIRLPTTVACRRPPCARAYAIARLPGSSREPDTMAASVSRRWHFAFSATSSGTGRASAAAMYSLSSRVIGETVPGTSGSGAALTLAVGFRAPAKSAIGPSRCPRKCRGSMPDPAG